MLILASEYGQIDVVVYLLRNGADVNLKDVYGFTAIACASKNGFNEILEILIQNEADIEVEGVMGVTPLMWATQNDHIETCKLLLNNGANINHQDDLQWTAVHYAAAYSSLAMVKLLVDRKADLNNQVQGGITALMLSASRFDLVNGPIICKYLIDIGVNLQQVDDTEQNALMKCVENGNLAIYRSLFNGGKNGWDLEQTDINSESILMKAVKSRQLQIVKNLVAYGANVDAQMKETGRTVVMEASRLNYYEILAHLLLQQPDLTLKDTDGWTAIMFASNYKHHECVKLLSLYQ